MNSAFRTNGGWIKPQSHREQSDAIGPHAESATSAPGSDIEGCEKGVLIAEDERVALGEEGLDEALAALAQGRGRPFMRSPVFVEIGHVLDHRKQERVA